MTPDQIDNLREWWRGRKYSFEARDTPLPDHARRVLERDPVDLLREGQECEVTKTGGRPRSTPAGFWAQCTFMFFAIGNPHWIDKAFAADCAELFGVPMSVAGARDRWHAYLWFVQHQSFVRTHPPSITIAIYRGIVGGNLCCGQPRTEDIERYLQHYREHPVPAAQVIKQMIEQRDKARAA